MSRRQPSISFHVSRQSVSRSRSDVVASTARPRRASTVASYTLPSLPSASALSFYRGGLIPSLPALASALGKLFNNPTTLPGAELFLF